MPDGKVSRFFLPLFLASAFVVGAAQSTEKSATERATTERATLERAATERPVSVAVLDFGETQTGRRVSEKLARIISSASSKGGATNEFLVVDRDQSRAAAVGTGLHQSLNLSLEEARSLGSAIGCDFFFIGDAQTLRRSPSDGPIYFEAYASIFLVSARTGKLIRWERLEFRRPTQLDAEQALLGSLSTEGTRNRYHLDIRRAVEDERSTRARAIDAGTPVIEVMNDEETGGSVRAPRPYRRLKPPYPEMAARDQVEATVDVLADIDAKGVVGHIEIVRWAGYGLDESVMNTVKQINFFPAQRDGVPIPMRVLLRYNFRKPAN
jgi:TonB family protein